jgi:hypothetical protein
MVNNNQNFTIQHKNMQIYQYKHDCISFVEALCVALDSKLTFPPISNWLKKMNYFIHC